MKKPEKVKAFFRRSDLRDDAIVFGLRFSPTKLEEWDTCVDMVELLCDAGVEIDLEITRYADGRIKSVKLPK